MLTKLVPDIQKTSELVAEINAASGEQANGIQQINSAIQQLNTVVQQNASAAEELTATAEELNGQTISMKESIIYLKTGTRDVFTGESLSLKNHHASAAAVHHSPVKVQHGAPVMKTGHTDLSAKNDPKKGVHIEMGKADSEDGEFERY